MFTIIYYLKRFKLYVDRGIELYKEKASSTDLRVVFSLSVLLILFFIIMIKAANLQFYENKPLKKRAAKLHERKFAVKSSRGTIYDRNKNEFAISIEGKNILAWPSKIKNKEATASFLSKILDTDKDAILSRIKKDKGFVYITTNEPPEKEIIELQKYIKELKSKASLLKDIKIQTFAIDNQRFKTVVAGPKRTKNTKYLASFLSETLNINKSFIIQKLKTKKKPVTLYKDLADSKNIQELERVINDTNLLKGIEIKNTPISTYPNGELAAQVIGFTGTDKYGLEGVQRKFEEKLKKSDKRYLVKRDVNGKVVYSERDVNKNYDGADIVLTLDKTIQYIAEKELKKSVDDNKAKSGMALVMDVKNGEILAMAHYPTFNPNCFVDFGPSLFRNRIVTDYFEPGSTLKVFVAAAALDLNFSTKDTIFDCENGSYFIQDKEINDVTPHKWLSLEQIIRRSSNIGMVKVAQTIRKDNMYKYLLNFGFGEKTGIDFFGETSGKLRNYMDWNDFDIAAISYGQGIGVSAIQLITAVSAIANGGLLMEPHLVKSLIYKNPNKIKNIKPKVVRRVIKEETARDIALMMDKVVNRNGTGRRAKSDLYRLCGKTGTAQKMNKEKIMSEEKYTASFLGFAPLEKPQISILVVVDEPEVSHQGGEVAAPVFKKVAEESLIYLNNKRSSKMIANRL